MKQCKFENLAYLYSSNMLSNKEIKKFEEHVRNCAKCSEIVALEKEIKILYEKSESFNQSIDLEEKIFNYILAKKDQVENGIEIFIINFLRRLIPPVVGIACLMFLAVLFTSKNSMPNNKFVVSTGYFYADANFSEKEKNLLMNDNSNSENIYYEFIESM